MILFFFRRLYFIQSKRATKSLCLFPCVSFFSPLTPYASDSLIDRWSMACNPGEESLCQSRAGAFFVDAYSSPTHAAKNDKQPVAGRNVAETGNASPMRSGEDDIRIIFEACTSSRRKPMEPGPSTRKNTARKTRSMCGATPLSSKSLERAAGMWSLSL